MRIRKLSEKTQTHYLRWVRWFTVFLGRAPNTATVEDLRRFQFDLNHLTRSTSASWRHWRLSSAGRRASTPLNRSLWIVMLRCFIDTSSLA
jgi:hypothetical protein